MTERVRASDNHEVRWPKPAGCQTACFLEDPQLVQLTGPQTLACFLETGGFPKKTRLSYVKCIVSIETTSGHMCQLGTKMY